MILKTLRNSLLFCLLVISTAVAQSPNTKGRANSILICGHRGGFYKTAENSIAGFRNILDHSKSLPVAIEIDLRKSKNGTIFLMHDETIDRTTNGTGKIAELSDEYLKSLFLKNGKGEVTTERIPKLADILVFIANREIILMLDIKGDIWEEALQEIESGNLRHPPIVLTFTMENTKKVFDLHYNVKISALIKDEEDLAEVLKLSIPPKNLIAYVDLNASENFIKQLKEKSISILAALAEHVSGDLQIHPKKYYLKLIRDKSIDILITDFPIEVSNKVQ
jgi:glycerophosphoryl diester phosphodiesterase